MVPSSKVNPVAVSVGFALLELRTLEYLFSSKLFCFLMIGGVLF